MAEPVILKKYGNRRLYDTQTSRYVTLSDVEQMIRAGSDIRVVDAKSEEDLTQQVLLQILLEVDEANSLLPIQFLLHVVRLAQSPLRALFARFLVEGLEAFLHAQKNAADLQRGVWSQWRDALPNALSSALPTSLPSLPGLPSLPNLPNLLNSAVSASSNHHNAQNNPTNPNHQNAAGVGGVLSHLPNLPGLPTLPTLPSLANMNVPSVFAPMQQLMPAALWNPFSMIATPPARVYEDATPAKISKTSENAERKLINAADGEVRESTNSKVDTKLDPKKDIKMGILAEDADDEMVEKREKVEKSDKSEKSNQRERMQRLEKEKSEKLEKSEKPERNDKDEEIALLRAQMQQTQELLRRILEGGFVSPQALGMMPAIQPPTQPTLDAAAESAIDEEKTEEIPAPPKAIKTRSRRSKV